ncbi:MAG: class I poly(R)-hydroxyalkanoic acid synthase [Proteobacteria bacterium]|nr:class I poly(R)-hydroxyalkanoic acid synthase [Pseudomonadota bacterium]
MKPEIAKPSPDAAPDVAAAEAIGAELEHLAEVTSEIIADAGKASVAVLKGLEDAKPPVSTEETADLARTFGSIAEYWLKDPARLVKTQKDISVDLINLWTGFIKQASGEPVEPAVPIPARDPRFADKDWSENPYFNMLRQAYFMGTKWADSLVDKAEVDENTKRKAGFYVRQLASALSPSNYVMTNPELLRQTAEEKGENLARGMKMLAEDIEAGNGQLKIRQSDTSPFKFGENIANTPGKVVFRNELIELIQYTPTTESVYKTPLLIVPPWINKFYILDLNAEKSFVRWAVSEGLTVFVISWINPDERHRAYDFEAYMKRGVLSALDAALEITGEKTVDTIGYCVGGTMLSVTLAYIAQDPVEAKKIRSATLFTTQVDFTHAGDLLAFVDEAQIRSVEEMMAETGYLPGSKMAGAFNMLRPNDLIWSYVVNNYLKGKNPAPFDLLYWNADSTRMPEANHSFYLRNCYLNNNFSQKKMVVGGRTLDLSLVKQKIYNLAAKEDHIAPAKSVFVGSKFFGGEVTYVLAGSGHIAGVINPMTKPKYQYWTNGPVKGEFEDWVKGATEHAGTWWPHWHAWLTKGEPKVPARQPGSEAHPPLEDAPGLYVRIKA